MHACHLVNKLHSSAIGGKTLLEVWLGKVVQDYDSLWVFGCPAIIMSMKTSWVRKRGKECLLDSRKTLKATKFGI